MRRSGRVAGAKPKAWPGTGASDPGASAPLARTRMSTAFLGAEEEEPTALDPAALGPLVVYLASEASAGVSGAVFTFRRGRIGIGRLDVREEIAPRDAGWTLDELHARLPMLLGPAG